MSIPKINCDSYIYAIPKNPIKINEIEKGASEEDLFETAMNKAEWIKGSGENVKKED